ncbi:MAG: T9SS type A sorting domain-containing protein [Bacteroidia bacterium]|nr:T9SS type A sorting domain-containing protein [Bacteroidia bacterium]
MNKGFKLIWCFLIAFIFAEAQNAPDKKLFLAKQPYYYQHTSTNFQSINKDSAQTKTNGSKNTVQALNNSTGNLSGNTKTIGSINTINVAPCVNEGFESTPVGTYSTGNAVTGWSLTSRSSGGCYNAPWFSGSTEFSIVSTPVTGFPGLGTVGHSPLGGAKVAKLGNFSPNSLETRLSTTFSVTSSNALFQYAFAGYFEKANVGCCDNPRLTIQILDCFSNTITCQSFSVASYYNGSCANPANFSYAGSNNVGMWFNWHIRTLDLTPYIGSCITIRAACADESWGARYASVLFDASCSTPTTGGVSYCATSSLATIAAPQGYASYTWLSPASSPTLSATQATQAVISLTNPVSNAVYTVIGVSASGCTVPTTYTISNTQVNLLSLNTKASCPLGSNGSATVYPTGSSAGYTYNWSNASNSVVSTSSVLTGALPGNYTVTISAANNSLCGSVVSAVSIATAQAVVGYTALPYCSTAFLNAPSGTNYQWYNGNTAVSGSPGNQPSLLVTSPLNNSTYRLGYTNQGCRDSVVYNLVQTNAGALVAAGNSNSCTGTPSGSIIVNYTPFPQNPYQVPNTFTILSASTQSPSYNFTLSTGANSFTNSGLFAGQSYTVIAFDGLCVSSFPLYVPAASSLFNFSVSLSNPTVCSGNTYSASISLSTSASPSQYAYSWTPNTFMSTGGNTLQSTVLNPTTAPGSTSSVIYTIVVTPTIAFCPVTNTFQLIASNPPIPSVFPIPVLCENDPSFVVQVSPPGGYYLNPNLFGIITPSFYPPGVHSNTYAVSLNSCVATSSFTFSILPKPNLVVSNDYTVCAGTVLTLTASGADNYIWSTLQSGSVIVVSPTVTSTYSVVGTHSLNTCQTEKTIQINTLPLPNVQALGNLTICAGETATLMGTGASGYTWVPNGLINPLIVTPSSSFVFTLQGSSFPDGCVGSALVKLQVNPCVGLEENMGSSSSIQVYPNPGKDIFLFVCEEEMTMTITNAIGQIIATQHALAGQHTIDLSKFSDGIYPVICKTATGFLVVKLVKQN